MRDSLRSSSSSVMSPWMDVSYSRTSSSLRWEFPSTNEANLRTKIVTTNTNVLRAMQPFYVLKFQRRLPLVALGARTVLAQRFQRLSGLPHALLVILVVCQRFQFRGKFFLPEKHPMHINEQKAHILCTSKFWAPPPTFSADCT